RRRGAALPDRAGLGRVARRRARTRFLDGDGRPLPLSGERDPRRGGPRRPCRRLPAARARAGHERLFARIDAAAARHPERADGVPDRRGARVGEGERRLRALAQLLALRERAPPGGRLAPLGAPARRPDLPDRAAAQLQREVLPRVAAAAPVLRAPPGSALRRVRVRAPRGLRRRARALDAAAGPRCGMTFQALLSAAALAVGGAHVGGDWPRFGYDAARHDSGPAATGITAANVGSLKRQAVELDGTVDS